MSFASRFFGLATAKVQLSNKPTRALPDFFLKSSGNCPCLLASFAGFFLIFPSGNHVFLRGCFTMDGPHPREIILEFPRNRGDKPPRSNRLVANIPLQDTLDVGSEPPHVRAVALLHKAQMQSGVPMNPARQSVDGLAGIATWEDFAGYFPATEHDERR